MQPLIPFNTTHPSFTHILHLSQVFIIHLLQRTCWWVTYIIMSQPCTKLPQVTIMDSTCWGVVDPPHPLKNPPHLPQSIMLLQITIIITITQKIRMEAWITIITMAVTARHWDPNCPLFILIKLIHHPIITFLAAVHVVRNHFLIYANLNFKSQFVK